MQPPAEPDPNTTALCRVLGTLNLTIGSFLLLIALGVLAVVLPFLLENHPFRLDPEMTRVVLDDLRRTTIAQLSEDEAATWPTVAKERIGAERVALERHRVDVRTEIDFAKINRELPWVSRYLWLDLLTAPLLDLGLVVSGLGMVLLRRWGKALARVVAGLKLVRLAFLAGFLVLFVVPNAGRTVRVLARTKVVSAMIRHELAKGFVSAKGPDGMSADQFADLVTSLGYGYALALFAFGAIYPVTVLMLLWRPRSKGPAAGVSPT